MARTNFAELHEGVVAKPGAAERLAQLRAETRAVLVARCPEIG